MARHFTCSSRPKFGAAPEAMGTALSYRLLVVEVVGLPDGLEEVQEA